MNTTAPKLATRGPRHRTRLGRLFLLCIQLLLVACRSQPAEPEDDVAVVIPTLSATWVRNFNPFLPSQALWPTPAGIYEPLLIYNRMKHEYVPWLATAYRFEDEGRTLRFTIRSGVRWSDGRKMTPDDVVFTWQLMRKHRALDGVAMWEKLQSVTREGQDVLFRFQQPFSPGLFFVGEAPIVPAHIWQHVKDPVTFSNDVPIGTGPFTEVLSFKTQVYELGRNPYYWQPGRPGVAALRVPAYPGNEQSGLALIRGEVDWAASFLPAVDRIFVAKDPAHRGYQFAEIEGVVMLYPNHTVAPLDQVEVRRALALSIDRARIVKIAMEGHVRVADATGLSRLYQTYHSPRVLEQEGNWARYDPEEAGRLLDHAGLERGPDGWRRQRNGELLTLDVNTVVGWSDWIIAGQIIVRNLRDLGIDSRLQTFDHGAWFSRLRTGDYSLSMGWSSGGPTPYTFYRRQMAEATYEPIGTPALFNWQRHRNPRVDALLDAFARTTDADEQLSLSTQLQREFIRNVPAIPLFPGPAFGEYVSTRVTGFPTERDRYAALAPYKTPGNLLTLVRLKRRSAVEKGTP